MTQANQPASLMALVRKWPHEQVIASGRTRSELEASARHYKRLRERMLGVEEK